MTQAPPALVQITKEFAARPDRPKSYQLGGIVGDAAHMNPPEGYHVSARDEGFRWGSYSLESPRDRAGGKAYPDYASAWDLSMDTADMKLVTTRLITAAKARDPRLAGVAEIAGTTNGTTVHAYYLNTETDDPNNTGGWASSHTSHVHLSISRDDCNNYQALKPIMDVICGVPLEEEFTMDTEAKQAFADLQALIRKMFGVDVNGDGKPDFTGTDQGILGVVLKPITARLEAIEKKLGIAP